jgi:hypothetical protein
MRSAEEFRDAIRTKDGVKFDAAFQKFTAECNNCHKGAGLEFIKIRVPVRSPIMTSPLSNVISALALSGLGQTWARLSAFGQQRTNMLAWLRPHRS